jgi:hypothetical protein
MSTMDSDTIDLIRKLCTRAGMLMEDMSLLAITAPPDRPGTLQESVATLREGCDDMRALIAAAEVLLKGPEIER